MCIWDTCKFLKDILFNEVIKYRILHVKRYVNTALIDSGLAQALFVKQKPNIQIALHLNVLTGFVKMRAKQVVHCLSTMYTDIMR